MKQGRFFNSYLCGREKGTRTDDACIPISRPCGAEDQGYETQDPPCAKEPSSKYYDSLMSTGAAHLSLRKSTQHAPSIASRSDGAQATQSARGFE